MKNVKWPILKSTSFPPIYFHFSGKTNNYSSYSKANIQRKAKIISDTRAGKGSRQPVCLHMCVHFLTYTITQTFANLIFAKLHNYMYTSFLITGGCNASRKQSAVAKASLAINCIYLAVCICVCTIAFAYIS